MASSKPSNKPSKHAEDSDSPASDTEESSSDYRLGGYHAVHLGERFNGRYVILRKLGWGHFSTVWLVHDEETSLQAALKVVKSAEHYTAAARDEVLILQHVRDLDGSDAHHCCRMLDSFDHRGPHGVHVCMVFEVLGDNLLSLIRHYDHDGIPLGIVKKLSREILEGLAFLHDECGVIHTDLKPENVMLKRHLKRRQEVANERAVASYERDPVAWTKQAPSKLKILVSSGKRLTKNQRKKLRKKEKRQREEGAEGGILEGLEEMRLGLGLEDDGLEEEDGAPVEEKLMGMECKIVDFGNACWEEKHFTEEIQTRQYRSPEVRVLLVVG